MTQAVTTGELAGQPFGFASPKAPPLTRAEAPTQVTPAAIAPPDDYAPPTEPVAALESITPAPPEFRDPSAPFMDAEAEPVQASNWTPNQPLPLSPSSASLPDAGVDLATLPPPTSPVPANLPPPTGMPVNALPASPYGANPYATGPYSTPGGYPAVAGQPAPGQYPAPAGAQPPPKTLLQQIDPFVMLLLFTGTMWSQAAPYAVVAAAALAAVRKVPGRIVLAGCGGLVIGITVLWYLGYLGTGQWLSSSQLMCAVGFIGMILSTRMTGRRPQ